MRMLRPGLLFSTDSVRESTLSVEFHEDAAHGIGDCITVMAWGKPDALPGTPDQMEAKRVVPKVPVPKVPLRKMTMLASGIGTKNLGEAIRGGNGSVP